jgi:predicted nucleic acid-binding protein
VGVIAAEVDRLRHIGIGLSPWLAHLEDLPVRVDPMSSAKAFSRTLGLARSYALSAYDAAYLELAIREHAPLATLDKSLRKAANRAGVPLYLR